jgi:hypothetical protein
MHAAFPRSAFASVRVCTPSSIRPAALASGRCWSDAALFPLHPGGQCLSRTTCVTPGAGSNGLHCGVAFVFCRPSCPWGRPCPVPHAGSNSPQAARRGLASCAVQYVDVVLLCWEDSTGTRTDAPLHCTTPLHRVTNRREARFQKGISLYNP